MMRTTNLLETLPRQLLILLFAYAAASKLLDLDEFRGQMLNQTFNHSLAMILVYALPAAELLVVVFMLFPRTSPVGLLLSLAMLLVFTGYIGLVLLGFWPRVPCSCGGILGTLGWREHLLFNLVMIALNLAALFPGKHF